MSFIVLIVTGFLFPFVLHWVEPGKGWLVLFGYYDSAGGLFVHLFGAMAALAVALIVGPRKNRFQLSQATGMRAPLPVARASDALTFLGTFLLWLGLYGVAIVAPRRSIVVPNDSVVAAEDPFTALARPVVLITLSAATCVVLTVFLRSMGRQRTRMVHIADAGRSQQNSIIIFLFLERNKK